MIIPIAGNTIGLGLWWAMLVPGEVWWGVVRSGEEWWGVVRCSEMWWSSVRCVVGSGKVWRLAYQYKLIKPEDVIFSFSGHKLTEEEKDASRLGIRYYFNSIRLYCVDFFHSFETKITGNYRKIQYMLKEFTPAVVLVHPLNKRLWPPTTHLSLRFPHKNSKIWVFLKNRI